MKEKQGRKEGGKEGEEEGREKGRKEGRKERSNLNEPFNANQHDYLKNLSVCL